MTFLDFAMLSQYKLSTYLNKCSSFVDYFFTFNKIIIILFVIVIINVIIRYALVIIIIKFVNWVLRWAIVVSFIIRKVMVSFMVLL